MELYEKMLITQIKPKLRRSGVMMPENLGGAGQYSVEWYLNNNLVHTYKFDLIK